MLINHNGGYWDSGCWLTMLNDGCCGRWMADCINHKGRTIGALRRRIISHCQICFQKFSGLRDIVLINENGDIFTSQERSQLYTVRSSWRSQHNLRLHWGFHTGTLVSWRIFHWRGWFGGWVRWRLKHFSLKWKWHWREHLIRTLKVKITSMTLSSQHMFLNNFLSWFRELEGNVTARASFIVVFELVKIRVWDVNARWLCGTYLLILLSGWQRETSISAVEHSH